MSRFAWLFSYPMLSLAATRGSLLRMSSPQRPAAAEASCKTSTPSIQQGTHSRSWMQAQGIRSISYMTRKVEMHT